MIIQAILALLVMVVGYLVRNSIEGEIKPSKQKMSIAFLIGAGLFLGSIFYTNLFPLSGVFFLWTGMLK